MPVHDVLNLRVGGGVIRVDDFVDIFDNFGVDEYIPLRLVLNVLILLGIKQLKFCESCRQRDRLGSHEFSDFLVAAFS